LNFSFFIAKRYTVSFSKNSAINIITGIASLGIVASAMALFVVLSAFSGLRDFSLSFTNASDPDLKAQAITGKSFFLTEEEEEKLKKLPSINSFSKTIEERVLFFYNEKEQVAQIKGVDSTYTTISTIDKQLYVGNWLEPETKQVVVGAEISRKLSLGLFDYTNVLEVYTPKPGKGTFEKLEDAFNISKLQPVGIYNINEEIDAKYVYCDLSLAQNLLQFKTNQITHLEFKLNPNYSEKTAISEIETILKNKVFIKNRMQLNDALYKMLNTENIAVYLIFTLVIIISLFNLIGALVMMIIEKKDNLKTLYNLGNTIIDLRRVFLLQGCIISFFGGILGLLLGALLVLLQQKFELLMITSTLAYPVIFELKNLALVLVTIFTLGFLASYIASRSVSKSLLQ